MNFTQSTRYNITTSAYLGGNTANDAVRGTAIQSDGTIVLKILLKRK